jgi:hypothetical protein
MLPLSAFFFLGSRRRYFPPKVKFTPDEDERLRSLVKSHGTKDWHAISAGLGTRNARQCRERWHNYLDPRVSNPLDWSPEEDARLEDAFREVGSRWGNLAAYFPARSTNNVKNRFLALQRQKQRFGGAGDAGDAKPVGVNVEPLSSFACLEDSERFGWFL